MHAENVVKSLPEQFLNPQILWACDSMNASAILERWEFVKGLRLSDTAIQRLY